MMKNWIFSIIITGLILWLGYDHIKTATASIYGIMPQCLGDITSNGIFAGIGYLLLTNIKKRI